MKIKPTDEWGTPQWLFDELNKEFNFSADLCASNKNSKCKQYWDKHRNFLDIPALWASKCYFMNPPYSNPRPFIQKAWELSKYAKIVCLVKVDPSTRWWAIFWDYENHKPRPGCEVRFLPKRVKFIKPKNLIVKNKNGGPSYASAIVIMHRG